MDTLTAAIPAPVSPAALRGLTLPQPDAARWQRAVAALRGDFSAVGRSFHLGSTLNWAHNPCADPEWLIEHHKQPVAVDLALAWQSSAEPRFVHGWCALIGSWLAQMGSGHIRASDAQVEARRLEHWLLSLAILQAGGALALVPAALLRDLLQRMHDETAYVVAHLRPARNHRTFQLHSVFMVAAALPHLPEAAAWREQAFELLCANLLDDFGADGVHIELSTHYHQITLEAALAFADLADACGLPLPAALEARLRAALDFSMWITLPDGEIPLIGDADNGAHLPLLAQGARRHADAQLAWAASQGREGRAPSTPSRWFGDAGYLIARDSWGRDAASAARSQHLFVDCGPLGVGSHAHYDLFSFCYAIGGHQLVVDPGRYSYHAEPDADGIDWRHAFKRTAAHNTVCIDGRDQTRYLSKACQPAAGLERLDRQRHPSKHGPAVQLRDRTLMLGQRSDWLHARAVSHEYSPVHSRLTFYVQRQYLCIVDRLEADDDLPHDAAWHLHLAADWHGQVVLQPSARDGLDARGEGWRIRLAAPGADCRLGDGWVSKHYGSRMRAPVLSAQRRWRGSCWFVTVIAPDHAAFAIRSIDCTELAADGESAAGLDVQLRGHGPDGAWRDHLALAWSGSRSHRRVDYECRSALLHERRADDTGHALQHLVAARPDHFQATGDLPVRRSHEGHIEW